MSSDALFQRIIKLNDHVESNKLTLIRIQINVITHETTNFIVNGILFRLFITFFR